MASSVDRNRMFSERILSTPAIFKETFKLYGPQGRSDGKTELIFPAFSLTFVDSQFKSAFAVSFHSTRSHRIQFESGVIFLDQSQFLVMHSNQ